MNLELKLLISKLSRDTSIPYRKLLIAVKKALLSGRVNQTDLIIIFRNIVD